MNPLGLLFESPVVRERRVYADATPGSVTRLDDGVDLESVISSAPPVGHAD